MARDNWKYSLYYTEDGSFVEALGGIGPLEIAKDGTKITNLVTGDTYDLTNIGGGSSSYSDEDAQDAVGSTFDSSLSYDDAAPSMGIAAGGVGTTELADDAVTTAKVAADAITQALIASGAVGSAQLVTEDVQDIAGGMAGSNLTYDDPNDVINATDTHVAVSEDGTEVLADVDDINLGAFLSVTDDGDNSVTVDGTDSTIRTRQAQIPLTEIADTNTAVGLQKQVPSGKTLRILEMGVTDDAESAPAGLTIEVQDLTNATTIHSVNAKHSEGDPLASKSGAIDVQFRVANATGGAVNASGYVLYTME